MTGLVQPVPYGLRKSVVSRASSRFFFVHSIMGVHVDRLRERALEHAQEKAANAESQGVCPYSAHNTEDNKSIYETLMNDDRVSKDLSANIIMALFRTGIDSVSWVCWWQSFLVSFTYFSSFRLGLSLVFLFSPQSSDDLPLSPICNRLAQLSLFHCIILPSRLPYFYSSSLSTTISSIYV